MSSVDPLAHLTSDHRNFLKLLAIVEEQLERIAREERADYELLEDVMEYMTHYPELVHHPTESMLADYLVAQHGSLDAEIRRLGAEHAALAAQGRAFLDAVGKVVDGALTPREAILEAGRAYVELQRSHVNWEDSVLFPEARRRLRPEDIEEIANALQGKRDPLFGPVRDAEYAKLWEYIARQHAEGRG